MDRAATLVLTVAAVGILHTIVPDHWGPIVAVARQRGWSATQTARAATTAGIGHVTTTLLLGAIVWYAGSLAAAQYAREVTLISAIALIAFGVWIAYGGWREAVGHGHHHHDHEHFEHGHLHRHADGTEHVHWHEHHEDDYHQAGEAAVLHEHGHAISGRTALLLILGSSPMVEGIPAFLAASTYRPQLLLLMAIVFAAATIFTYVALSVAGLRGVQRRGLGAFEKYGEMLSGVVVALVGVYQLIGG